MAIDFELYKAFYHVARAGNVTHAAQELFISQPALTKRIRLMEEQLGCQLFVRLPKGMALTPEGQELYPYAEQACLAVAVGENRLQSLLDLERGEVRIGASDLLLQRFFLPNIVTFCTRHPQMKISTHAAQAFQLLDDVRKERIDIAVLMRPLPPETDAEFTIREIGTVEDIFIAGEPFRHLQGRVVPWEELLALPLVGLSKNTATRRFQGAFFHEKGMELSPRFELANTVLIVPFVECGLGVGLIISAFAEESLASGRTFPLVTPDPIPSRVVCAITSKNIRLSLAAQEFYASILA